MSKKIPNTIRGIGKPTSKAVSGRKTANSFRIKKLKSTGRFTPEEIAYIKHFQQVRMEIEFGTLDPGKCRKRTMLWP